MALVLLSAVFPASDSCIRGHLKGVGFGLVYLNRLLWDFGASTIPCFSL